MIAINMLFPGGAAQIPLQLEGLFAAHMWEFLTKIWPAFGGSGGTLLPTPPFFTTVVNTIGGLVGQVVPAVAGPRGATVGAGRGASTGSGPLPDSWRTRGPGQRLG
jgi:Derlin-2/3